MTDTDDGMPRIRAGPRWDAVVAALDEAEGVLELPLGDDELDDGWSDELRRSILADVRRVHDELSTPFAAGVVLEDWSAVDAFDASGDAERVDAILDVDLVLGELERAERALLEASALLEDLAVPPSATDDQDGFDELARTELRTMLEAMCRALSTGEYLSAEEMDPWADALRGFGFLRGSRLPGGQDDATARGFTKQRIEQFPPGRRWERVAIFDGWLCNVASTDVLDEEEAGEEAEDRDGEWSPD
jgi:hypothetical protein